MHNIISYNHYILPVKTNRKCIKYVCSKFNFIEIQNLQIKNVIRTGKLLLHPILKRDDSNLQELLFNINIKVVAILSKYSGQRHECCYNVKICLSCLLQIIHLRQNFCYLNNCDESSMIFHLFYSARFNEIFTWWIFCFFRCELLQQSQLLALR